MRFYSSKVSAFSSRIQQNMLIFLLWTLLLVWFRSYYDVIIGATMLSLISVMYILRDASFDSFFASEALLFFLCSLYAILTAVSSWDMLIIYLALELQGLCFYTLCVINGSANGATEAAIKYLLLSGLASSLLLFISSLRYGETGTTNIYLWMSLEQLK